MDFVQALLHEFINDHLLQDLFNLFCNIVVDNGVLEEQLELLVTDLAEFIFVCVQPFGIVAVAGQSKQRQ